MRAHQRLPASPEVQVGGAHALSVSPDAQLARGARARSGPWNFPSHGVPAAHAPPTHPPGTRPSRGPAPRPGSAPSPTPWPIRRAQATRAPRAATRAPRAVVPAGCTRARAMEPGPRRRRRSRPLVAAFLRDPGSGRVYRRGKLIGTVGAPRPGSAGGKGRAGLGSRGGCPGGRGRSGGVCAARPCERGVWRGRASGAVGPPVRGSAWREPRWAHCAACPWVACPGRGLRLGLSGGDAVSPLGAGASGAGLSVAPGVDVEDLATAASLAALFLCTRCQLAQTCVPLPADPADPSPQGAFSRCYKLTDMSTGAVFALKVVPRGGAGAGRLRPRGKVGVPIRARPAPRSMSRQRPCPFVPDLGEGTRGKGASCSRCPLQRVHVRAVLQVEREIALHSRLRHRNIVAFHGHFADRDHVYMVLEYCSHQVRRAGERAAFMSAVPVCVHPVSICTSLLPSVPSHVPSAGAQLLALPMPM
ncbi:hypothetical protein P7K49_032785 [Saguinus oedipus]|uniref:Protein kinase domain-containing protein n=1 Tax=Saguinus oedipus TaxID=9490 RepID=A0ABQ9TQ13_SAGOE|nr:hypothetical protein P7K49_032785 [Saguinus oedipus]